VVSSEPYIPWELMIPNRDGTEDEHPIGVSSAVGRWIHEQHLSPRRQPILLEDSCVIAPTYNGSKRLSFSSEEARFVCEMFAGRRISPALFATIEEELGQRGAALVHLICHGSDSGGGGQVIDLDPDEILTEGMLGGMRGLRRELTKKQPLVFINACEVGRQTPALVGTGGFASAFIKLGANAVVAPIWSVEDSVAAQAARRFYSDVKAHPGRPFATILRDIRRRAYDGPDPEDSWAAYCFYGDPLSADGRG
jgi:CHAT domain-containing protein